MRKMSELHQNLEIIRAFMEEVEEDDMGEPLTPREEAEHKVAMAVRDCYLASAELYRLRLDPIAAPFVAAAEGDLWSILNRVQLLVSEIRAEQDAPTEAQADPFFAPKDFRMEMA